MLSGGGGPMNKTPTREIMDDEIIYRNMEELPPDELEGS